MSKSVVYTLLDDFTKTNSIDSTDDSFPGWLEVTITTTGIGNDITQKVHFDCRHNFNNWFLQDFQQVMTDAGIPDVQASPAPAIGKGGKEI